MKTDFLIEHLEAEKEKAPLPIIPIGKEKALTGKEIIQFLSFLNEMIEYYDYATVGNVHDFFGMPREQNDDEYGWTDVGNAEIVYLGDGQFGLKMPTPTLIDCPLVRFDV